jgi:PAS domain S-box-containing protein
MGDMADNLDIGFKVLFELTNDAVFIADARSGELLDANSKALEMIGCDLESIRGKHHSILHPEEERERLSSGFREASNRDQGEPIICGVLHAGGFVIPCEIRAQRVECAGRRLAVGVFHDISERLRALEDIHLRNVAIANVGCGVTIADARLPDMPLIYVNKGFEDMTGYSAREAVGRSCRFLQAYDRDQSHLAAVRDALHNGQSCNVRLRNYRKDGSLFWNELHLSPVRSEQGELTHFVGIQLDVTDRVQSRQALEASEARYRMLADSVEDMICRRSLDGRFDFVSPASRHLLGYDPEELSQTDLLDLVHAEDRPLLLDKLEELKREQSAVTYSFRWRHRNGDYRWAEATDSLTDAEDDEDLHVVSVVRDITLRKRAEEEIRRALEQERRLNEIRTRFISMVSHEFRTPLTGIRASASFLHEFGERVSLEKREQHFQNIERSLVRMNDMLDEVLFVGRSESGKLPFKPRAVEILTFFNQLTEEMLRIHPQHTVELSAVIPEGMQLEVDPDLLRHISQNLIGNALKYSPVQSPVEVALSWNSNRLTIVVQDRGIGIPEEDQPRLFEPFHRACNVGTIRGTGLGLNIAKRSVELHGGTITFVSKIGEGTRFEVILPAPLSLPA